MHVNYEYLLSRAESLSRSGGLILDYGCGKGGTVEEGVRRGLRIYGVEAFSHGSGTSIKAELKRKGLLDQRVMELQEGTIPFPDHHFDIVISNQVFEHVVDLDKALIEIRRVLKPGGKLLCLFPSKEVIREGHCGILFAHWLHKSKFRYLWLLLCRSLGFGRLKRRRTRREWAAFFNEWLSENVTYRTIDEIHDKFGNHIGSIEHREQDYVAFRLSHGGSMKLSRFTNSFLFSNLTSWLFRRVGGLNMLITRVVDD